MDPLTLISILSAAGALGGLGFKDNNQRDYLAGLDKLTSPDAFSDSTDRLYRRILASPAFAAQRRASLGSANSSVRGVGNALARTGLSSTGVGAITGGLSTGLPARTLSDLFGGAYSSAAQQAMQLLMAHVNGFNAQPSRRNISADVYSGALGSLGPIAQAYSNRERPMTPRNPAGTGWMFNATAPIPRVG